jgi:hypothetical protein
MIGRTREVRLQTREVGVNESVALHLAYHISRSRLGRRRLAVLTGLSEMAVRIELDRMRDRGFVMLRRSGAELPVAGRRRFRGLLDRIVRVEPVGLSPALRLDDVGLGAHLTSGGTDSVWAIRDEAVREGATGLLLLRHGPKGWAFAHDGEPVGLRNPRDAETIGAAFPDPSDGDLLPIVFGADVKQAGLGLWRAVLAVLAPAR